VGGRGAGGLFGSVRGVPTMGCYPRKRRPWGGPARAGGAPGRPSPTKLKPARDLSGRAYVARSLAPAGTSAVGSSVANNNLHIGRNHEYSMTTVRARRVQSRPLAPDSALG